MNLVLTRIDSRLIHGQVLEAWVPHSRAECIVVANDDVAHAPLRRTMMEACVPKGIRVVVGEVADMARRLEAEEFGKSRVMVLFASSVDALRAYREGFHFTDLNLGHMHPASGKVACSCTISLDAEDVDNLSYLEEHGVRIMSRCVPQDGEVSWKRLVRSWGEGAGD